MEWSSAIHVRSCVSTHEGFRILNKNSRGDTCEPHEGLVVFSLREEVDTLEVTVLGKVLR